MKIERFTFSDTNIHTLLSVWWESKSTKALGSVCRSDYGFMAWDGDSPIVSIFLYPTLGSRMALVGFPIANPEVDKEKRREALESLVAAVEDYSKELKYDYLISYAGSKGAVELFNRADYQIADKEVTQFVKRLK